MAAVFHLGRGGSRTTQRMRASWSRKRDKKPQFWVAAVNAHTLIVKDDPDSRVAIGVRLRARGYVVPIAGGGEAAISRVTSGSPDLIILNLDLLAIERALGVRLS